MSRHPSGPFSRIANVFVNMAFPCVGMRILQISRLPSACAAGGLEYARGEVTIVILVSARQDTKEIVVEKWETEKSGHMYRVPRCYAAESFDLTNCN